LKRIAGSRVAHVWIVLSLVAFSFGITYYNHFERQKDVVFSHFFYLPIILGGVWWGLKAVPVAVLLAVGLAASHQFSGLATPLVDDVLRGFMFIVVGAVLGLAVEQRKRLQEEVVREHRLNLEEMEAHLRYVEQVAHELRNPLQVTLGALDSLDTRALPPDQKVILELLERNAEKLNHRIKELTPDDRN
jgi:signal transduction histidine kinase